MKRLSLTAILLLICAPILHAQSDKERAHQMTVEAVQKMDAQKIDEALEILEEAKKLDPKSMDIPYEMGYAYLMKGESDKAVKMFKPLLKHKDAYDRVYIMLGNAYDYNSQPDMAIKTYEKGLKKFPNSGGLHLERGNMHLQKEEYNAALEYYEKGIEVDPNHSSNYYRAAKIYFFSNQKIWAMMYAEIYILLEPGSDRALELSSLLYNCYIDNIEITSDTSTKIDFCENIIVIDDISNFKMPYCSSWGTAMSLAVFTPDTLNIPSLSKIRSSFISNYYTMGYDKSFPNILYEYRKGIEDAELGDAYNHYILMIGDVDYIQTWIEENEEPLEKLQSHFENHPFELSSKNKFYRKQYD